jgi:glycosyltransferase involved in cell wall biosynthesis
LGVTLRYQDGSGNYSLAMAPTPQKLAVCTSPVLQRLLWASPAIRAAVSRKTVRPLKAAFIGGVMPHKGVHMIAAAAQYFMPADIEFHIFGFVSGQYLALLKEIDRKGMLVFHGEYRPEALEQIALFADIAIVPSLWQDCAPLVLLELEAMRLPVIAANIGGMPDFICDGVNGFFINTTVLSLLCGA